MTRLCLVVYGLFGAWVLAIAYYAITGEGMGT